MNHKKHTPYTYLIGWTKHNKWYYGRRTSSKCHPSELWITYFTSSKHVANFRRQFGDPDVLQIRKTFQNAKKCCLWESKVLKRLDAQHSDLWLNQKNGDEKWDTSGLSFIRSKKSIEKKLNTVIKKYGVDNVSKSEIIKNKRQETFLRKYGVEHNFYTEEFKAQVKSTWLNNYGVDNPNKRTVKCQYCNKNTKPTHIFQCRLNPNRVNNGHKGASNGKAKEYQIIDPNGTLHVVIGELKKFCHEHCLSGRLLVENGKTKGWTLISSKKAN